MVVPETAGPISSLTPAQGGLGRVMRTGLRSTLGLQVLQDQSCSPGRASVSSLTLHMSTTAVGATV